MYTTYLTDEETSETDQEITYPPMSNRNALLQSSEENTGEADSESEAQAISTTNADIPFKDDDGNTSNEESSSDADDESAAQAVRTTNADTLFNGDDGNTSSNEIDDENASNIVGRLEMERFLREQAGETRFSLTEVAANSEMGQDAGPFDKTLAKIIDWWQKYAEKKNITSHQIDFGVDSPVNLLMVLALLPENYQGSISIEDKHRSPSDNGENLSWLHEQTMDVLVKLSMDPNPAPIVFGQGLASMIRDDVDKGWRGFTGRSWLEDQLHLWSNDQLEPEVYRFPLQTKKIVFFFNPTETHWTVVEVNLDDDAWTYTLYNSLSKGKRGPIWKACKKQFPLLEQLICRVSGFTEPESRQIVIGTSAQQENLYDCGPIAICNAIELLHGRSPRSELDAEELRLMYLTLILDALSVTGRVREPSIQGSWREVSIDNPN